MSGICGVVNLSGAPVEPAMLRAMAEESAFRGPRGITYHVEGNVGLAHLALEAPVSRGRSSWEASGSGQPCTSRDGRLLVTCDARLDNRRELTSDLRAQGFDLPALAGDAEILLAAYACWGEACLERLVGDFAFGLWDAGAGKLLLGRDAVGARLLHYHWHPERLLFASDARQILASGVVSEALDGFALSDVLTANFHRPHRSMFAAVQKLPPGYCLAVGDGRPRSRRHWNPDELGSVDLGSEERYVEAFREVLFRAVEDRMGDGGGSLAILVSGGVDSSSVAVVAQELFRLDSSRPRPLAFVEIFERCTDCDERAYSSTLRGHRGLAMEEVAIEKLSLLHPEGGGKGGLESPYYQAGDLLPSLLGRMERAGCRALLNGFGGDSLFDGARLSYHDHARQGRVRELWPWLRGAREKGRSWPKVVASMLLAPFLPVSWRRQIDRLQGRWRYWHVPDWVHPKLRRATEAHRRLSRPPYPRRYRSFARQTQYEHIVSLAQQGPIIEAWGHNAARAGLEMAYPLLDRRLAELVLASPLGLGAKPGPGRSKWLLRQAVQDLLPETIYRRADKGNWGSFLRDAYCRRHGEQIRAWWRSSRMAELGLVDPGKLGAAFEGLCSSKAAPGPTVLGFPIFLEGWLRDLASVPDVAFRELEPWQRGDAGRGR